MTPYNTKLSELLALSTLTHGRYRPSSHVQLGEHAAVYVGDEPVLLTGYSDDHEATQQALQLSRLPVLASALKNLGYEGSVTHGIAKGSDINWYGSRSAVVQSASGKVEDGTSDGILMTINLTDSLPLTVLLCINTEAAQIIDPLCPVLDDGGELSHLAALYPMDQH